MADADPKPGSISVKKTLQLQESADDKENMVSSTTDSDKEKNADKDLKVEKTEPIEQDEDDVPPDFFDDFLNKDFLAGLDVVDTWEDGGDSKAGDKAGPARKTEKSTRPKDKRVDAKRADEKRADVKRADEKRPDEKRPDEKRADEKRVDDKRRKSNSRDRKHHRPRRSKSRERRSRSRGRRSKSLEMRRDPNKTKRDIQKDKVKCAKEKEAKFISEKLKVVETGLVPPGMEMEFDLERVEQPKQKSRSPERRKRNISLSPSPPKRRRYESPIRRRYSPPARRSPVRMTRPPKRTPSPLGRDDRRSRQDTRRPDVRHSRRSNSPVRSSRGCSFLDELGQKLNIREEENKLRDIQQKINGGPSAASILNKYAPVSNPTPAPVPNPHYQQQQAVYDQQFFIGHQEIPSSSYNQPLQQIMPNVPYNMYDPNQQQQQQQHNQAYYNQAPIATTNMMQDESIQKLFNDENISLTKFLSLTARAIDNSKPLDIKDKIKVITRCQDGIKLMSEYAKPTGRFYYKKSTKVPEKAPESKYQSPLKKTPPIRFHFTTKALRTEDEKVCSPITKLLMKLGLNEEPITPIVEEAPDLARRVNNQDCSTKIVQTEPFKCKECETRQNVRTYDISVQCSPPGIDFSCQVTEDDFLNTARSALKNMLKNQSLATLTPAQILAAQARCDDEVFPAARRRDSSPEQNFNRMGGISNNDSFPGRQPQQAAVGVDRFDRRSEYDNRPVSQFPNRYSNNPTPLHPTPNIPHQSNPRPSFNNYPGTSNYMGSSNNSMQASKNFMGGGTNNPGGNFMRTNTGLAGNFMGNPNNPGSGSNFMGNPNNPGSSANFMGSANNPGSFNPYNQSNAFNPTRPTANIRGPLMGDPRGQGPRNPYDPRRF